MLLQLRDFITKEKRVSTEQITRAFCMDFSALEPMLEKLISHHMIMRIEKDTSCKSSCQGCSSEVEWFEPVK